MKLLLAIAILLNIYGVLSNSVETDQQTHHHHKHDHHAHHKNHHDGTSANELTVDDLANVLVSLPGSLGRQAYRAFLALGEFLPADTKAHKFFMAIPEAIKKKSRGEISELRRIPMAPTSSVSSDNPIFMVQPVGYHMVPLPLHPMFSSSLSDYFTRVPCAHTKVISVPLHTFDVKISATTRRFGPIQSSYDESQDSDDDEGEDRLQKLLDSITSGSGNEDLQKLLEVIGAPSSNDEEGSSSEEKPEEGNADKGKDQENIPENKTEDDSIARDDETSNKDEEAPSSDLPNDEGFDSDGDTIEAQLSDEDVGTTIGPKESSSLTEDQPTLADQTPPPQEDKTAPPKEEPAQPAEEVIAQPKDESVTPLPQEEETPPPAEEVIAQPKEESVTPLPQEEETPPPAEEVIAQPKEESVEQEDTAVKIPSPKKGKKKSTKKGRKAQAKPNANSTEAPEAENAPASSSEPSDQPSEDQNEATTSEKVLARMPGRRTIRRKSRS